MTATLKTPVTARLDPHARLGFYDANGYRLSQFEYDEVARRVNTYDEVAAGAERAERELADERANGPTAEEWRRTHARAERAEAETAALREAMRKARQHVRRIYSHYPEDEVAEAAYRNDGSSLSEYGLALRILDAKLEGR
jgi:rhamnose utilization protein RhaD (predicted bifunctional aldolase and dehydrogenase)